MENIVCLFSLINDNDVLDALIKFLKEMQIYIIIRLYFFNYHKHTFNRQL